MMKKERLKHLKTKKVKLNLKNNYVYTGIVQSLNDDCLFLLDKFQTMVIISLDEIISISNLDGDDDEQRKKL